MTRMNAKAVVVRETLATIFEQGKERPVVVELRARTMVLRLKGTRRSHELTYDGLYWRAAQIEAGRKGE